MKVFVLNYLCEYEYCPCEMYCEGVFTERSQARTCMEILYNGKKEEWLKEYDIEDIEESDHGNIMKLFNVQNNIDYVRYEIFEMEVE